MEYKVFSHPECRERYSGDLNAANERDVLGMIYQSAYEVAAIGDVVVFPNSGKSFSRTVRGWKELPEKFGRVLLTKHSRREIREGDLFVPEDIQTSIQWVEDLFEGKGGWNVELTAGRDKTALEEIFGLEDVDIYASLRPWLSAIDNALIVVADGECWEREMSVEEKGIVLCAIQQALPALVENIAMNTKDAWPNPYWPILN